MILTRTYSKQTNAYSVNSTQHTQRKKIKTAAEVIEVLHNSLLEMIAAE